MGSGLVPCARPAAGCRVMTAPPMCRIAALCLERSMPPPQVGAVRIKSASLLKSTAACPKRFRLGCEPPNGCALSCRVFRLPARVRRALAIGDRVRGPSGAFLRCQPCGRRLSLDWRCLKAADCALPGFLTAQLGTRPKAVDLLASYALEDSRHHAMSGTSALDALCVVVVWRTMPPARGPPVDRRGGISSAQACPTRARLV